MVMILSSKVITRKFLLDGLKIEDFDQDMFRSKFGSIILRRLRSAEKDTHVPNAESVLEINSNGDHMIYLASRIVTTFRLSDEGGIGYNREFVGDNPSFIGEYGLPYRPPKGKEDIYKITSAKLIGIKKRFEGIEDIVINQENTDDSLLRLALSRFNRSYDDANEEDILIDLMICFEILFIFGKTERLKGSNIAGRSDEFLKKESRITHPKIKCDLKNAYDIRNDVVHEGKRYNSVVNSNYPTIGDPWKFLLTIRSYGRDSLLACIQWLTNNKTKTLRDWKNTVVKSL